MDPKTDWKIERVAEAVLLIFLIAAVAGAFGGLPTMSKSKGSSRGTQLEVDYRHTTRAGLREELRLIVRNTSELPARKVLIGIDRRYLDGFSINRITPEPDSEGTTDGKLVLAYSALKPGDTLDVQLDVEASGAGRYRARAEALLEGVSSTPASASFETMTTP